MRASISALRRRVRLRQPAPRRDAVGHVDEALGPQAGEVGEDGLHQQLRVQRRHAVDLVAADDRQVRHAHAALAVLVDQRQPAQELVVARPLRGGEGQEFLVDAQDDLQVPRQHLLHQRHRPGLQRLGHQRVVGVAEDAPRQRPGLGPRPLMLVAQHPHQLGHADRRVRVVEVDRHLVGERVQRAVFGQVARDDVLDRCAGEEVLLAQAQLATGRRAVVRVQHPRDVLELVLHLGGARVVAAVEGVQIDVRRRRRLPQPQRADLARAVARHHHVEGLGIDFGGGTPQRLVAVVFDPAAEAHRVVDAQTQELPRRTVAKPRVGMFHLPAFDDALREHAVLVADAVAERRQSERGHRIEETRRQPAEAAVAQRRIGLLLLDVLEPLGMALQRVRSVGRQVQRRQRVAQRAAHQEFHRQVVHAPAALLCRLRGHPALRQLCARQVRHATQPLGGRGGAGIDADMVEQLLLKFDVQAAA